jgi:hypothetical protein
MVKPRFNFYFSKIILGLNDDIVLVVGFNVLMDTYVFVGYGLCAFRVDERRYAADTSVQVKKSYGISFTSQPPSQRTGCREHNILGLGARAVARLSKIYVHVC